MSFIPSIQQCPDCSQPITFAHDAIALKECSCGKVVFRNAVGVLRTKPVAVVDNPPDIIQSGVTGSWRNRKFTVKGRIRAWFNRPAVFNYWTIIFNDGEAALLAEGYGIYAILLKGTLVQPFSATALGRLAVGGKKLTYGRDDFLLERKSVCYRWELQGEAMLPEYNSEFNLFELAAETGEHIVVFEWLKDSVAVFTTHYVSFKALALRGLRQYNNEGKKFACQRCSAQVQVATYPFAQSVVCESCGSRYVAKDGVNFKPTGKREEQTVPAIPLGCKGTIKGISYNVVGYAKKEEKNAYHAKWCEYTLFNPEEGYAFLSEYNGHWIYLRENPDAPVLAVNAPASFYFGNQDFRIFNEYGYRLLDALGEFPYNVDDTGGVKVKEYIDPPLMWVREQDNEEGFTWFSGKNVASSEIKNAFPFPGGLPHKSGIGALDYSNLTTSGLIKVSFTVCMLFVLIHMIIGASRQNKVLFDSTLSFKDSVNQVSYVSGKFQLHKWRSNLAFDINAPVDNSWVELNATLVNADNGAEYNLEQGVEYYHGYSDGESWSEGSTTETAYLSSIPAGTYYLQLSASRDTTSYPLQNFYVVVKYDVSNERNLFICMLLFLALPAGILFSKYYKEKQRWSGSSFSPYNYLNDDE